MKEKERQKKKVKNVWLTSTSLKKEESNQFWLKLLAKNPKIQVKYQFSLDTGFTCLICNLSYYCWKKMSTLLQHENLVHSNQTDASINTIPNIYSSNSIQLQISLEAIRKSHHKIKKKLIHPKRGNNLIPRNTIEPLGLSFLSEISKSDSINKSEEFDPIESTLKKKKIFVGTNPFLKWKKPN